MGIYPTYPTGLVTGSLYRFVQFNIRKPHDLAQFSRLCYVNLRIKKIQKDIGGWGLRGILGGGLIAAFAL